jgi:hypothetical protein
LVLGRNVLKYETSLLCHVQFTMVIALLQPAPETFDLVSWRQPEAALGRP